MSTFELHRALRLASPNLLRKLFEHHHIALSLDWGEVTASNVDPLLEAIRPLDEGQLDNLHIDLSAVHDLTTETGVRVLHEEVQAHSPLMLDVFDSQHARFDKALWTLLNLPQCFENAAKFAEAIRLSSGRSWVRYNGLPKKPIEIRDQQVDDLERSLSNFFWQKEGRGRYCHIEHHERSSGEHYLFCHFDDYPDATVVFDSSGVLQKQHARFAFDAVIVLDTKNGLIEMYVKGGRPVYEAVRERACAALLDVEVGPADPMKPEYRLDHLLQPGATLKTHPADMIESVQITRVRVRPVDRHIGYVELHIDAREHGGGLVGMRRAIQHALNQQHYSPDRLHVLGMTFKLVFTEDAPARSMSFDVNCPNNCTLKSKPETQRLIGERCLRDWEVSVA